MKKYLFAFMLVALMTGLAFSLYGCGGGAGAGGPIGGVGGGGTNPDAPAVTSIVDSDGDNVSTSNDIEEVFVRVKGQNLGTVQGIVRFTNVDDGSVIDGSILTWSDTQIVAQIDLPAGKWLVTAITDDSFTTTDQIFYLKGTGSFPVTAQ